MRRSGPGFGVGLVAFAAICRGAHLPLLAGLPLLATLTGRFALIPLAGAAALTSGLLLWRQRQARCAQADDLYAAQPVDPVPR